MTERQPLVNKKDKTVPAVWKHFGFKDSDVERKEITFSIMTAGLNTPVSFLELTNNEKLQADPNQETEFHWPRKFKVHFYHMTCSAHLQERRQYSKVRCGKHKSIKKKQM